MLKPMRYAILGLSALLLFGGCAYEIQRFRYRGMDVSIVVADQRRIDRHCRNIAHRRGQKQYLNDRGQPVSTGNAICCADQYKRIIWVGRGYEDCIPHELCHLEHKDPAVCDEVHAQ